MEFFEKAMFIKLSMSFHKFLLKKSFCNCAFIKELSLGDPKSAFIMRAEGVESLNLLAF